MRPAAAFTPQQTAFSGLRMDFIVKHSVFHTQTGLARLKNSNAGFRVV